MCENQIKKSKLVGDSNLRGTLTFTKKSRFEFFFRWKTSHISHNNTPRHVLRFVKVSFGGKRFRLTHRIVLYNIS